MVEVNQSSQHPYAFRKENIGNSSHRLNYKDSVIVDPDVIELSFFSLHD